MSVHLQSREMFISPRKKCKENTTKEIPGLKYQKKLFQNQKLDSELKDFQSILIVSSHPPISEQRGLNFKKMGKGATNFEGHFLILSYHCN